MDDWFGLDSADDAVETPSVTDVGSAADVGSDLWVYDDGQLWDLGPAEFDADADGVADSILTDVDGDPAIFTDTDGDGRLDRATRLGPSGSVAISRDADEPLPWRPASLGRLP